MRLFRRRKTPPPAPRALPPAPTVPPRSPDELGLGIEYGSGTPFRVKKLQRGHHLVLGMSGTGKSTYVKHQIIQHIQDGDGVILFDPHGDLAHEVAGWVPPERREDLVFIDPTKIWDHMRVVKLNPLEVKHPTQLYSRAQMFIESLHMIYDQYWGPRLEDILRNAIYALAEVVPGFTIVDLRTFVANEEYRHEVLGKVSNSAVREFWRDVYPKMDPDSFTSVDTKLGVIGREVTTHLMFSSSISTIDFRKLMDEGKIVVVRLPEGKLTGELVNIVGSLLLSMIYLAAMSREDIPERERRACYVYVDEAHRFITKTLRDAMRALRKYNVYLTIVTQSLRSFDPDTRREVLDLAQSVAVFALKEAEEVAPLFAQGNPRAIAAVTSEIMNLAHFHCKLMYRQGGVPCDATLALPRRCPGCGESVLPKRKRGVDVCPLCDRVFPPPPDPLPYDAEEAIRASLERYGAPVGEDELRMGKGVAAYEIPTPPFTPAEALVLFHLAEEASRGKVNVKWDELKKHLKENYQMKPGDANQVVSRLVMRGLVGEQFLHLTADEKESRVPYKFHSITEKGLEIIFPVPKGPRGGREEHTTLLGRLMREYMHRGYYPLPCTGKEAEIEVRYQGLPYKERITLLPDLLVYPLQVIEVTERNKARLNLTMWDVPRRHAVEVETDPCDHPKRVVAHFQHLRDLGIPVMFVVSDERKAECVRRALADGGANLVEDIERSCHPGNAEVRVVQLPSPREMLKDLLLDSWLRKQGIRPGSGKVDERKEEERVEIEILPTEEREPPKREEGVKALPAPEPPKREEREEQPERSEHVVKRLYREGVFSKPSPPLLPKDVQEAARARRRGRPKTLGKGVNLEAVKRKVRELTRDGWTLRVKISHGDPYLVARKRIDGKWVDRSVCRITEEVRRILEKHGLEAP